MWGFVLLVNVGRLQIQMLHNCIGFIVARPKPLNYGLYVESLSNDEIVKP